jgi:hypothetical protein
VKAQIQPLTAVLVTTVVVLSVAGAFTFGSQVLDKRQAQQGFESTESQMVEVYSSMVETADGGQGDAEVIDLSSDVGSVRINGSLDYLQITTSTADPPYPAGTWSLVRGQGSRNLSFGAGDYGVLTRDSRGVLAVRPSSSTQGTTTLRYRTEFRNMLVRTPGGRRLDRIDIQTPTGQTRASNPDSIRIENTGDQRDFGSDAVRISTGETLDRTRTVLEVTLD